MEHLELFGWEGVVGMVVFLFAKGRVLKCWF